MTLKDKIECTLERQVKLKENQSENIEKIVEDFAISFVEWKYKISDSDLMYSAKYAKSNKELVEMYKKTLE
jgi:hypothetical protein